MHWKSPTFENTIWESSRVGGNLSFNRSYTTRLISGNLFSKFIGNPIKFFIAI